MVGYLRGGVSDPVPEAFRRLLLNPTKARFRLTWITLPRLAKARTIWLILAALFLVVVLVVLVRDRMPALVGSLRQCATKCSPLPELASVRDPQPVRNGNEVS